MTELQGRQEHHTLLYLQGAWRSVGDGVPSWEHRARQGTDRAVPTDWRPWTEAAVWTALFPRVTGIVFQSILDHWCWPWHMISLIRKYQDEAAAS